MVGPRVLGDFERMAEAFTETDVLIIGGGMSGIALAVKLLAAGISRFSIVEKSSGFGGTWRDNRYPGCRCDIPAHLYCFSFAGNSEWTRPFPAQPEILSYIADVAAKHKLHRYTRLSTAVEKAEWDETERVWNVSLRALGDKDAEYVKTYKVKAKFLASAVGQLNVPSYPKIPGLDDFAGKTFHSARWDLGYNLQGKRIALIGSGATAIQILPEVGNVAAQVTMYQRTPGWIMPKEDEAFTSFSKAMLRIIPFYRRIFRARLMDSREAFHGWLTKMGGPESEQLRAMCLGHMQSQLPGREDLWKKLTPDYAPGCKRLVISNDYFPALQQDNVDVETTGIQRITSTGITTTDGKETEYDCIILASGFRTQEFLQTFPIIGADGRSMSDIWKEKHPQALYGITVEGLPNFGMLYGPNTNLSHTSVVLMIEAQANYIVSLAKEVLKPRSSASLIILPKPSRVREYNESLQASLATTTLADSHCRSWYKTEDGHIINNWFDTAAGYQKMISKLDWKDYDLRGEGTAQLEGKKAYVGDEREGLKKVMSDVSKWGAAAGALLLVGNYFLRLR